NSDSDTVVGTHYHNYQPSIIELPSSRPMLPLVFNFRTQSSPIVATQTHLKVAHSSPKVQYFETIEPPHYHKHVVYKPVYQHLRESILPYRLYVQQIEPVQEYKQTLVHMNKNDYHHMSNYPV